MCAKILYAASTWSHLSSFHLPYIAELRAQGHQVVTLASGGADIDFGFKKSFFAPANFVGILRLARILRQHKFDEVYLNTSLAACFLRLAMVLCGKPKRVVNVSHGYLWRAGANPAKNFILRCAEGLTRRLTDLVVTMNEEDYCYAKAHRLGKAVANISGMGVDTARFFDGGGQPQVSRADFGLLPDDFVILCIGELSRRKNQSQIIAQMPQIIKNTAKRVRLLLAGSGDEAGALMAAAEGLPAGSVQFLGHRKDIAALLAISDVVVSASHSEGLPFGIIEAVLAGVAVVATDIKGHRDILLGSATARLVPQECIGGAIAEIAQTDITAEALQISSNLAEKYTLNAVFVENMRIIFGREVENEI